MEIFQRNLMKIEIRTLLVDGTSLRLFNSDIYLGNLPPQSWLENTQIFQHFFKDQTQEM